MNEPPSCPPLADLLRVSDGEGTPEERRAVNRHLWRCSPCRDRVAALESLAIECASSFASAPEPDADEVRTFAEGLHRRRHLVETVQRRPLTWLSMAAAVTALVVGVLLSQSQTAILRADEFLARVAQAEEKAGSDATNTGRVRLQWIPMVGGPQHPAHPAISVVRAVIDGRVAEPWAPPTTERMLSRHGVDWQRPLSIARIREWRQQLRDRREHVSSAGGLLTLRVRSRSSELRLFELVVRSDTYAIVRGAFLIDSVGRLEVEALPDGSRPLRPVASPLEAASHRGDEGTPTDDVLELVELQARHALHAVRLDLSEDVRLSVTSERRVRVEGSAPINSRRELTAKLEGEPFLEIALRARTWRAKSAGESPMLQAGASIQAWLNQTFGEADAQTHARFLTELIEATDRAVRQVEAIVELERRYSDPAVARMSPTTRASFQMLAHRHYVDLNDTLDHLAGKTAVLRGSARDLPVALTRAPADWRARARRARQDALDLGQLLPAVVTAGEASDAEHARASFDKAFRGLWTTVNGPSLRPR